MLLGSDDYPYIFAGKVPVTTFAQYAYVLCSGTEYNIVDNGAYDNSCVYTAPAVGSLEDAAVIALVPLTSAMSLTYKQTYANGFQFSTHDDYPAYVYLFYKSSAFTPATSGYGLQLFDPYGNPTFDTDMGKMLRISEAVQITAAPGASATLAKSYTKPGVMFSSCYCRSTRGSLTGVTNPCGTWALSLFTSYGLYLKWDGYDGLSIVERAVITNYLSRDSYYNWYPANVADSIDGRSLFVPVVELSLYD